MILNELLSTYELLNSPYIQNIEDRVNYIIQVNGDDPSKNDLLFYVIKSEDLDNSKPMTRERFSLIYDMYINGEISSEDITQWDTDGVKVNSFIYNSKVFEKSKEDARYLINAFKWLSSRDNLITYANNDDFLNEVLGTDNLTFSKTKSYKGDYKLITKDDVIKLRNLLIFGSRFKVDVMAYVRLNQKDVVYDAIEQLQVYDEEDTETKSNKYYTSRELDKMLQDEDNIKSVLKKISDKFPKLQQDISDILNYIER